MHRYIVTISNRNVYREIELTEDMSQVRVGTGSTCDIRLRKDLFFEMYELRFFTSRNQWMVTCSENVYIDCGDLQKLFTRQLSNGDTFLIRYQASNNEVLRVEFSIDFENGLRKYEREIDLSSASKVTIGVDPSNNIRISSPFLTNDAVELVRVNEGFNLIVKKTTFGVKHNGTKMNETTLLKNKDFFSVSDYVFYLNSWRLWTEIRSEMVVSGLSVWDHPLPSQYPRFVRNTRIKSVVNEDEIEILDPPVKPEKPKNNLLMTLLPSVSMILTSAVTAYMGGGMIVISIISAAMGILSSVLGIFQSKKDYKKDSADRIEKYHSYIDRKKAEIANCRQQERTTLESIYIDSQQEIGMVQTFSSDLFDRIPADEDFLCVRLGKGDVEAKRKINYKKQERLEVGDDLQVLPETIASEEKILRDAPVVCDFKKANAVGLYGPEEHRFALFKNILLDISTRQYHSDVQMFLFAKEENHSRLNWLRYLPNFLNPETETRNLAFDDDSKNRLFDYLYKELSQRQKDGDDGRLLIIFYDDCGFQSHPISKFLDEAKDIRVTFLFMAGSKASLPINCDYIIQVVNGESGVLTESENGARSTAFKYETVTNPVLRKVVDLLAPVCTEEISLEGTLTKNISLFELLDILSVDDLDLEARWNETNVSKSMLAPIGVSKTGLVSLDLHDKAHGPHGLVAGTTGSGKSEILQTYILSVATLFHPYEISFLIIDFKGGGMVNQFKLLPHLVGAITNIDGKEIDRSLKSIKAELQKRQRLFAEAEVNHIDKYIARYKKGEVSVPIPHLVVIVDEFAELKAEQPDFMKELISAARIGRSLGVHLILATQKPAGQVDDQIWSNSRFKLCLKVQSQEDSNEVLKSPLAAEIKEPGRAYLQVGNNEIFELFQSAYSGAPEKMDDSNVKEFSIFAFNESGKKVPVFVQKKKKSSGNITQLESIVNYVNGYCVENRISKLPNICLPALEKVIPFPAGVCRRGTSVDIGIYDDPDNQFQGSAWVDIDNKHTLIIGSSQYGKTNLIQSMIRSIAYGCSSGEANIYILDFGSMVLKNFEGLNHVGGVVCASDDEKLKNLFKLLFNEISTRKERLLSVGVSSLASYCEAGYHDIPHIYLFVDNLAALIELYLEDDDSLLTILREGVAVGISVIVANSQMTGIGYRYLSNFANKIALFCNDSGEYDSLFDHTTIRPDEKPGRCVLEMDKRMLECQSYLAFGGEKEINRVREMQQMVDEVNLKNPLNARPIPCIPNVLTERELREGYSAEAVAFRIPIGLDYAEVSPFYLDLAQAGLFGLCGKEGRGHRNFINHMLRQFEDHSSKIRLCIFDDVNRKLGYLKSKSDQYFVGTDSICELISEWHTILEERYDRMLMEETNDEAEELLLLLVQNNEVAKVIQDDYDAMNSFTDIVTRFKGMHACIIFTDYPNSSISYDAPEPLRMIKQDQHLVYFDNLDSLKPFDVDYEALKANRKPLGTGDAYYIHENIVTKLKIVKADD